VGALKAMMTKKQTLMVLLIFAGALECGWAQGTATPQAAFEVRRQRLIDVVSRERDRSFNTVTAKLFTGNDKAFALMMLDSLATDESIGGMFYAYSAISTYLKFRDQLPDSLKRKIRQAFRARTMYRGDTENHWVMYYTGIYLAAQT